MFERNWRSARKADKTRKRTHVNPTTNQDAPAMMNIYAIIDLAAITEEVIEGVYFGQLFHDISSPDFMESSSRSGDKTPIRKYSNSEANVPSNIKSEVSIILDFAYEDFTFSTQPGALRRVSLVELQRQNQVPDNA